MHMFDNSAAQMASAACSAGAVSSCANMAKAENIVILMDTMILVSFFVALRLRSLGMISFIIFSLIILALLIFVRPKDRLPAM